MSKEHFFHIDFVRSMKQHNFSLACLLAGVVALSHSSYAATAPGSGVVGQPSVISAGGCQSCGTAGTVDLPPGFYFSIGMGSANLGGSAGEFTSFATSPSTLLATPAALTFSAAAGTNSGVEVVTNASGWVSQVLAPQAFAVVSTNSDYAYQIRIFSTNAIGAWNGAEYSIVNPSGNLLKSWAISNPDGSTNFNRIQIAELPGDNVTNTWLFSYSAADQAWTNRFPGGLGSQRLSQYFDTSTQTRIENVRWLSSSGVVVYEQTKVYTNFGWGEGLIEDIIGSGGAAQTTRYDYYAETEDYSTYYQPPLKSVVHPDGGWEYYQSYDTNGRPLVMLSGVDGILTTDSSTCRSVEYSYDPIIAGDDGKLFWTTPRKEVEKFKGTIISVTYRIYQTGDYQVIQCTSPTAAYNDPGNLVTRTLYYTSGVNNGSVKSTRSFDGTLITYDYVTSSSGYQTNIIASGAPDGTYSYVVDGSSNRTILSPFGYTVSSVSKDISSGFVVDQQIYGNFDNFGRPQSTTYLDGTTEESQYASCCDLIDNRTDRDGVLTQYSYDALKRRIASARLNITTTNILDAAGRVLKTIRIGSDNSQIELSQAQYDTAGRLIAQTNALGGKTIYAESHDASTGGLIRTTINPDGGTVTNYYYLDGNLKKVVGSAVHGQLNGRGAANDINGTACIYFVTTNLNTDGTASLEWTKTYMDMMGRTTEILYADGHYSQSYYDSHGRRWKQVDADDISTLYQYNAKGELEYTVIDLNQNDGIDFGGIDRISRTVSDVTTDNGTNVRRTRTYAWGTDNQNTSILISTREVSTDGLRSWNTIWNNGQVVTSRSQTVYASGGNRYMTNTAPDGSYTVTRYLNGRLTSVTRKDANHNQLSATTYAYDAHGRQYQATDARNGTTTYGYNNADQVTTMTTPVPGAGQSAQVTVNYYNKMLQITNMLNPDGTSVSKEYFLTGELKKTYGSRTYPVEYTYDYTGRMKTMKTWQNFLSGTGAAITTWNYDLYRGWLTNKAYVDGHGPVYSNTPAGRLASRTWARGITTDYGYNNAGDLWTVVYSDDITPNVTNSYDRRGRLVQIDTVVSTESLVYNDANELLNESFSGGTLNGLAVTNAFDSLLRRTAVGLNTQSGTLVNYSYDAASRLSLVTNVGGSSAVYTYLANSPLVSQIAFNQSGTMRMMTSKSYDYLNRLTQISSATTGGTAPAFTYNYTYNDASQRTRRSEVDGSYWVYQYDALGQVTSGKKYWQDGTPVAGQQFEYSFDDIGNRKNTKAGGDEMGANLRSANYAVNMRNQYTSRDVPGYVDILGLALATNTVTVNGFTPYRHGEYFRKELGVNNSSAAVWTNITVSAPGETSVSGNVFVPKTAEVFGYDLDGNMTNDGRWAFTWDAENRLVQIESVSSNPTASKRRVTWEFDGKGRRIRQKTEDGSSGTYVVTEELKFINDGWRCLAELNATNNVLVRRYGWGLDFSGSMDGAGGVGGLLWVKVGPAAQFYACDGNGNVVGIVHGSSGIQMAAYEYDPFGRTIRMTGDMARSNPFRFSTKRANDSSDLMLYEYRIYNSSSGRWLTCDPIMEPGFELLFLHNSYFSPNDFQDDYGNLNKGDLNSYAFVKNSLPQYCDPLGLSSEPDVTWALPSCPFGDKTVYIQVLYGGWGPYSGPRVDDGGAGFYGRGSKECPDYPSFGHPGVFEDSPSGTHGALTGPVQFITCRVCLRRCCPTTEWRIRSIGPCVYWKKGDKGDLGNRSSFTRVSGPPQTWEVALDQNYPAVARGFCYECLGKK